ncbi:MAG: outer membrane beta-barrel protein [Paludibacteraceae bacterium]|nr:outer membrane beta-barrel protein [Paludibacteraceae bacterium]MBR6304784.1 outer membrane beta-barrel protein [Paludibacteraceae bacterium]
MRRIGYIVLFVCLCAGALWADDRIKPAMQIEDNTFFDPSKKEEAQEPYSFSVDYRLEVGFVQNWQRVRKVEFPDMYLNGVRLGATFTFNLPLHFGLQTGVLYTLVYGSNEQHWRSMDAPSVQTEYIRHRVLEHSFAVPVRVYYTIPLWKQLNLLFYTGPQLYIGAAENDYMETHLSEGTKNWLDGQGIPTEAYDRMTNDLIRANIQWGLGAGLEWDRYRLQGGYDFGLNNLVKHKQTKDQHMAEWGWFVSFSYKF